MLFNTFEYFVFFLGVLAVSWLTVGWKRFRLWLILVASFYFYASNNSWQTLLLLLTTTIDYLVCLRLSQTEDDGRRKLLVGLSLISNLGMLAYFKYINFFGETAVSIAQALGWSPGWLDLNVALPVGISFYTFEALSYTIDVYRRRIPAERDWSRLAFLVSFFPHLVAGPIIRAADFFPQLGRPAALSGAQFDGGLFLIARGVVKKLLIADTMGRFADTVFASSAQPGPLEVLVGIYAFALQIYFDFSGYTDIAIGSAKLLGFQLPENFNRPYAATCLTDFWRRWHMSLSSWLKDYLYIPLGGSRMKSKLGVCRNLAITMLLGGLWHGAAWNFVIWGGLHGAFLSFERLLGVHERLDAYAQETGWRRLLRSFVMFNLLVLLWLPFRVRQIPNLNDIISLSHLSTGVVSMRGMILVISLSVATWAWQFFDEWLALSGRGHFKSVWHRSFVCAFAIVVAIVMGSAETASFIYFQF
jgi:alginate O-acetyltransferase complex protein AlgI